jgi:hypothetical protein
VACSGVTFTFTFINITTYEAIHLKRSICPVQNGVYTANSGVAVLFLKMDTEIEVSGQVHAPAALSTAVEFPLSVKYETG